MPNVLGLGTAYIRPFDVYHGHTVATASRSHGERLLFAGTGYGRIKIEELAEEEQLIYSADNFPLNLRTLFPLEINDYIHDNRKNEWFQVKDHVRRSYRLLRIADRTGDVQAYEREWTLEFSPEFGGL